MDLVDWNDPHNDCPLTEEERLSLFNRGKELLDLVRFELGKDFQVQDDLDWIINWCEYDIIVIYNLYLWRPIWK